MKIFSNPNATLKSKYGQYQIAVLGSIVGVSAEGIADGSAIERYARDMMDVINSFGGNHWALSLLHWICRAFAAVRLMRHWARKKRRTKERRTFNVQLPTLKG